MACCEVMYCAVLSGVASSCAEAREAVHSGEWCGCARVGAGVIAVAVAVAVVVMLVVMVRGLREKNLPQRKLVSAYSLGQKESCVEAQLLIGSIAIIRVNRNRHFN